MMPAVGNTPMQNLPGSSAAPVASGTSKIDDAKAGVNSGGFGSVMTAAFTAVSHPSNANLRDKVRAGVQGAQDGSAADEKNAVVAGDGNASSAAAKAGKTLPNATAIDGTHELSSDLQTTSAAATPVGLVKTPTLGLRIADVAAQNVNSSAIVATNAQKTGITHPADAVATSATAAGEKTKDDLKKPEAKLSVAPSAIPQNGVILPSTFAAIPIAADNAASFTAKSTGPHGDIGSKVQAAATSAKRNTATVSSAQGVEAVAGSKAGIAAASMSKSDLLPELKDADRKIGQNAATEAVTSAETAVNSAAHTVQEAVGTIASHMQGSTPFGTKNVSGAGNSTGGGFAATLLNGQPGMASAAAHPQPNTPASGVGAANPYLRMDETHSASLVYASPQKMSIAVSDPSLGNFQVQAQSAGAQIAASLATASAATHAQLSGQLPSLAAFLQEQRVDLARVTVVQQSMLGGDTGARGSGGQQSHSGSSGSRKTRSQTGRVGASGSATNVGSFAGITELDAVDSTMQSAAAVRTVSPQEGFGNGISYVDVHV